MANRPLPSRARLWGKFCLVLFCTGMLSWGLSELLDRSFWLLWASSMGLAIAGVTAALGWAHSWLTNRESRGSQVRLLTLFYLVTVAAIYFSAIRWLFVAAYAASSGRVRPDIVGFAGTTALLLFVAAIPLLSLAECVIWTAAWAVRQPFIRRQLARVLGWATTSETVQP